MRYIPTARPPKLLKPMNSEKSRISKAKAEGKFSQAVSSALKLLARGKDAIEEIADIQGLTVSQVKEVAKSHGYTI